MLLRKSTGVDDPTETQDFAAAVAATDKALALSRQNLTALAARAKILKSQGKCDEARSYADRVLALADSNIRARVVLAQCAMSEGHLVDAAAQYEALVRLNPANPANGGLMLALGYLRLIGGQGVQAAEWLNRSIDATEKPEAFEGMNPLEQARLGLITAYVLMNQRDRAVAAYAAYNADWPGRSVWRVRAYFPKNWISQAGMTKVLGALGRGRNAGDRRRGRRRQHGRRHLPERRFRADPAAFCGGPRGDDQGPGDAEKCRHETPDSRPWSRRAAVIDGAIWWNPTAGTETAQAFVAGQAAQQSDAATGAHHRGGG